MTFCIGLTNMVHLVSVLNELQQMSLTGNCTIADVITPYKRGPLVNCNKVFIVRNCNKLYDDVLIHLSMQFREHTTLLNKGIAERVSCERSSIQIPPNMTREMHSWVLL
jgi:hypothetical protein